MAAAAVEVEVEEAEPTVEEPNMRFLNEELKSRFIYLFQYGSKDVEGVRKLSGLFPSTSSQMVMSGINNHDRNINIEEWNSNWGEGGSLVRQESIKLTTFLGNIDEEEGIRRMALFKRYYSWLSSVVMPRELVVIRGQQQMKLESNEDEHVLAYGFMLTFGGGLGKLPTKKTASSSELTLSVKPDSLLHFITKYGIDPQFYSNILSDDTCCALLRAIGYNDPGILKFVRNTFLLNYHGMFFSEQVANQVKSNLIFIRLQIKDGKPKFSPSFHRIEEFCKMMEIYKQSINTEKISELNAKMELAKQPESPGEQVLKDTYYNTAQYTNKFFLGGWQNVPQYYNIENAQATMNYILNQLCHYLNQHAIHRLFFNIVMNKIYLTRYKKKIGKGAYIILKESEGVATSLASGATRFSSTPHSPPREQRSGSTDHPNSVPRKQGTSTEGASAGASKESSYDTPDNEFIKTYVGSLSDEASTLFKLYTDQNEELKGVFDSILPNEPPAKKKARMSKGKKGKRGGRRKKTKRRRKKKKKTRRRR